MVKAGSIPLVAMRPYGFGVVVFTAFNFWDKPFRGWDGLPNLWRRVVEPLTVQTVASRWNQTLSPLGRWQITAANPFGAPRPPDVAPTLPFRLEVPSGAFILAMLLVYFLLVVPISFAILKRRRALDWQWLIAPTTAILFVFLIARSASWLYQLANQAIARAVLVAPAGESEGYLFVGATLFFQQGGTYSLDLGPETEAVFFDRFGDNWSPTSLHLDTIEDRTTKVPLDVTNLAFRQIYFTRPIRLNGTVELKVQKEGDRLVRLTCVNRTGLTLKRVECRQAFPTFEPSHPFGGWSRPAFPPSPPLPTVKLPDIAPGQRITATMPLTSTSPRWVVLLAQVDGLDIAPQLNAPATRKSFVMLQIVCPMP